MMFQSATLKNHQIVEVQSISRVGFRLTDSITNLGPHGKKCKLGGNNYEHCPAREVQCTGEGGNEENCEDCKLPSCT